MTDLVEVILLLAVIGLLIVWSPPSLPQGPKPKPGDDVCDVCHRALLKSHYHGVTIHPRPKGPRPAPAALPPRPDPTRSDLYPLK